MPTLPASRGATRTTRYAASSGGGGEASEQRRRAAARLAEHAGRIDALEGEGVVNASTTGGASVTLVGRNFALPPTLDGVTLGPTGVEATAEAVAPKDQNASAKKLVGLIKGSLLHTMRIPLSV